MHVKVADEAYGLGGSTPADSYLLQDKLIEIAQEAGADAVHPGYGFLAENGPAQKVIDAGLVWIGPRPGGDRLPRRQGQGAHIALLANAPLVPGTKDPVSGPDEVVAFAQEHGLPVAIKAPMAAAAAGSKWPAPWTRSLELYESAVREAVTAFGRGECSVERFLDHPRHVETHVSTNTAMWWSSRRATARFSDATRSSSKKPPAPFLLPHRRPAR